jgi:hypothetical protein
MRSSDGRRMIGAMEPVGTLYSIEDDLSENWLDRLAAEGMAELESLLVRHLAFESYLEEN